MKTKEEKRKNEDIYRNQIAPQLLRGAKLEEIKDVESVIYDANVPTRARINVKSNAGDKETLIVVSLHQFDNDSPYSLGRIWHDKGHTSKLFDSFVNLETYTTNIESGNCTGFYDGQTIILRDRKGHGVRFALDFEHLQEANTCEAVRSAVERAVHCYKTNAVAPIRDIDQ